MHLLYLIMIAAAIAGGDGRKGKTDDTETLQNASSASVPREIPIGLPESGTGSSIVEDGLILTHAVVRDYFHWAGGNSYGSIRMMGLTESIIQTGEIAMSVDSRTRLGEDSFRGLASFQTSSNGLIRFDGNISGPLRTEKGLYYSLGAYVNMDPTSVNAPSRKFVDQKQIYKLALTWKTKRSHLDLTGKFSLCQDAMPGTFSSAPFYYNGDGSVSPFKGFRLGRDCYYTADDEIVFKDVLTGEGRSGILSDMNEKHICDLHVNWDYTLGNGWYAGSNLQFCFTPRFQSSGSALGGIVDSSTGLYSFTDGQVYNGDFIQLRRATIYDMGCNDLLWLFRVKKESGPNIMDAGLQFSFATQFQHSSTLYYAHTVEPNPVRICKNGEKCWDFNTNALFYECRQHDWSMYVTDDWVASDRLFIRAGTRLMLPRFNVACAANRFDPSSGILSHEYDRYNGFSIEDIKAKGIAPAVITHEDIDGFPMDFFASAYSSYKLLQGLYAVSEFFYGNVNKTSGNFKGNKIPSMKPMGYAFGSAGLAYENEPASGRNLECRLTASFISNWNNATTATISNPSGTLVNTFVAEYGIETWGITFDGNMSDGRFSIHLLVNRQEPKYKNYSHTEHFDDGSVTSVNFNGKYVTSVPQWRIEADPSYSWQKCKLAANLRYFSRQFASRNNYAWFKGHFESFASFSWNCTGQTWLTLSLINPLLQYGASGEISASDAATAEEELAGIVMSGSYIRPFTADLSLKIKF